MKNPQTYLKAILGAVAAGLSAAVAAFTAHGESYHLTVVDWLIVALAVIGGFNAVFWTKNATAPNP